MFDAWLYEGLRTPFGRHGGALAASRPSACPWACGKYGIRWWTPSPLLERLVAEGKGFAQAV